MAISQNIGTTITALLPALFAIVAPPGSANVPLTVGAIAFAITAIAAIAAYSARETFRLPVSDLGNANATPMAKQDYEQAARGLVRRRRDGLNQTRRRGAVGPALSSQARDV